jgi:uncharacterized protein (UPF0548 family)
MLRAAPFTYEEVGATASGRPAGCDWLERSAPLVRRDFESASTDLFMWRLHERAGLRLQGHRSHRSDRTPSFSCISVAAPPPSGFPAESPM